MSRNNRMTVLLTDGEKKKLVDEAKALGMTVGCYVRWKLFQEGK